MSLVSHQFKFYIILSILKSIQLNKRPALSLICSIERRAEIIADISLAAPTLYLKDTFIAVPLLPFYLFTFFAWSWRFSARRRNEATPLAEQQCQIRRSLPPIGATWVVPRFFAFDLSHETSHTHTHTCVWFNKDDQKWGIKHSPSRGQLDLHAAIQKLIKFGN